MSAPLPKLPDTPLDLPENPLGAAPRAPLIGKREPLKFPTLRRAPGQQGERSTSSPLPTLKRLAQQRRRPQGEPSAVALKKRQAARQQPPIIVTPPPRQRPAPRPTPAPPPPAPPPQRAQIPGHLAQPPINPQPGTQRTLHQRLGRRARAAAAHGALTNEGANPMAEALRHHVPTAETRGTGPRMGQGLTPEQRAQMRAQAQAIHDALHNQGENPMAGPMRHLGEQPPAQPPAQGGQ